MHLNRRTGRDVEGLPCPDQSRDPQAMDRRQLAGRAMNDQVHVRLIALEFKNSANNQLLRGTYLRRPGAVRRGKPNGRPPERSQLGLPPPPTPGQPPPPVPSPPPAP